MFHPLTTQGDTWMSNKDHTAAFAALKEAIEHGDDRRSPLYRWMWTNHDKFAGMLDGARPNWKKLAEVFAGLGFSDDGKPLRSEGVRQTWYRVRRAKDAARRARKSKPEAVGLAPDVVREVVSPDAVNQLAQDAPVNSRPRVSPISPVSPAGPVSSVKPASVVREVGDPDEVMRKLDEQLSAGRSQMPKPIK